MGRRLFLGVLFGALVYAGILVWVDLEELKNALAGFPLSTVAVVLALSCANYLIRFIKWQRYLRLLDIELDLRTSFTIYLSGFSMGVTPGKMGEVLKSWMLRQVTGTPIHHSAPIVIAERVTDLLGYLILVALGGIASHPEYRWVFWGTLALVSVAMALAGSSRFAHGVDRALHRTPYFWRHRPKVEGSFESLRVLLAPRQILFPTAVSVLSWGCECLGFWFVANAFVPGEVSFLFAVFAYAISAVAGALALFVPGGLGVTEWSLGALLRREYEAVWGFSLELARSKAVGAILITRLATLWFGVVVGLVASFVFQRRFGAIELSDS